MQKDAELVAVTLLDAAEVHGMKVEQVSALVRDLAPADDLPGDVEEDLVLEDRGGLGREHRAEHR